MANQSPSEPTGSLLIVIPSVQALLLHYRADSDLKKRRTEARQSLTILFHHWSHVIVGVLTVLSRMKDLCLTEYICSLPPLCGLRSYNQITQKLPQTVSQYFWKDFKID